MKKTQALSDQEVEIAKEAWSAGYEACKQALEQQAEPVGYVVWGINAEGKHYKRGIYTLRDDWASDDCKLGDYWAGNDLVYTAPPDQSAEIERLNREIDKLHTVMMAAAVEITEHWDAHCDEEGYGPFNLVRRLENCYAEQYGYDAKTVVRMDAEIERLKEREQKLIANFHVNMIRAYPEKSHDEITAHINQVLEGQTNE